MTRDFSFNTRDFLKILNRKCVKIAVGQNNILNCIEPTKHQLRKNCSSFYIRLLDVLFTVSSATIVRTLEPIQTYEPSNARYIRIG
jgi:hypothetical protein